jgi:hypothetical protein
MTLLQQALEAMESLIDSVTGVDQVSAINEAQAAITDLRAAIEQGMVVQQWVPVSERLPGVGEVVLVREPASKDSWTSEDKISFDFISEDWEDWNNHCEGYEHYMAIGGSGAAGPDCVCTGPSEKAPYTYWMKIAAPPAPITQEDSK